MAKSPVSELNHRLFAKLLMFLTLLLGGFIGYFVGYDMGEQHAIELLEKGRESIESSVDAN